MKQDIGPLSAAWMEDAHTFTRTEFGCIVDGPMFVVPKYVAVGGSPDESEEAARKLVRELSDLDVRPVRTEIGAVKASVRRVS